MNRKSLLKSGSAPLALLLMLFAVNFAMAFSSGPPDGRTGAPGEGNCTGCHTSFELDSGDGSFSLTTGQTNYTPDEDYTLVIELADPLASRWGFELTFIDSEGLAAGNLSELDANTQVTSSSGRQYGKHTFIGTNAGQTSSNTWMMNWSAPAEGAGTVSLYAMGNAANNNGSNSGDYIYSFRVELDEGVTSGVDPYAVFASLDPNYPNPFNPKTRIPYSLEEDSWVRLSIYDSRGRLVTVLEDGPTSGGDHESSWAGRDSRGQGQPSGVYLARLTNQRGEDLAPARKMILSK